MLTAENCSNEPSWRVLLLAGALAACGGTGPVESSAATLAPEQTTVEQGDAPSSDPTDVPARSRLYVGALRQLSPDGSRGYLFSVPSLGSDARVDLGRSVEIADAWVFGQGGPDFFTASLFEPTITRWHVTEDGQFEQGPTLSFANLGVTGTFTASSTPLWSEDKAFFIDSDSMQLVVWNPRAMELVRALPLNAPSLNGLDPIADITVRPDRIFVSVFWASQDSGWTRYGDSVRLITIDPVTEEILDTTDDSRCSGLGSAGVTSTGTAFFSPWDYHATVRSVFGAGFGSSSCGLRVVPPASSFDQGYDIDLSALVGGRPAGGLKLIGDDEALLHVWQDELVGATADNWQDTRFEPGYKWYRWQLGEAEATELPDQAPSAEGSEWSSVDGQLISFANNDDYSATTLQTLDELGHFQSGLEVPGWIVSMVRAY